MKYAVVVVSIISLAFTGSASAKSPTMAQFNALKTMVVQQRGAINQHADVINQHRDAINSLIQSVSQVNDRVSCSVAITFDAIRAITLYLTGGDIGRIDDAGACARIGVSRGTRFLSSTQLPLSAQVGSAMNALAAQSYHAGGSR